MRRVWALLLMAALGGLAAEKPPLTDDLLYDRVIRRLANDREVKTTAVEVEVKDRVVTLRGLVESEKMRQRIETVTRKTDGVRKVVNELKVRP